jgi:hypothetical protein
MSKDAAKETKPFLSVDRVFSRDELVLSGGMYGIASMRVEELVGEGGRICENGSSVRSGVGAGSGSVEPEMA